MVTFCLGSARQKRAYFTRRHACILENGEVLFCASENGRNFFAYGAIPFASFTVGQYLRYTRGDGDIAARFGLKEKKLLGSLCSAQLRMLDYAAKRGAICGDVVIDLDGVKYSRRNAKALCKLVSEIPDACVCVSDDKFVKKFKGEYGALYFGKKQKRRVRFYSARLLAQRLGAYKVAVM